MAPDEQFPPPGAPPPVQPVPPGPPGPSFEKTTAAPGYGAPGPTSYQGPPSWQGGPPPGLAGAAHKPGAIPIRPLRLGDMYDAAFKIIRFNPRATVGSAALVASIAMVIPVVITLVLSLTLDLSVGLLSPSPTGAVPADTVGVGDALGIAGAMGSLVLGLIAQSLGLVLVTGMIAHVTMAAAVGRRLSLREAWDATHGRRWRLIGLTVLFGAVSTVVLVLYVALWTVLILAVGEPVVLVLWGVVTVPAVIALYLWAWVRLSYLAVPALMLERAGVFEAVGRAFRLTRRQFWRTLGIALLTGLIAQVAGSIISFPVSIIAQVSLVVPALGAYQVFVFVMAQALSTVIVAAFVSPFSAAVASLQYVDQRMRKEALDVELLARAGITTP